MEAEEDLMLLSLVVKKKRVTARKSVFTRHINALQHHLDRWRADPVGGHHEQNVTNSLSQVREDKERALEVYDCIQADDNVSEQVFSDSSAPNGGGGTGNGRIRGKGVCNVHQVS